MAVLEVAKLGNPVLREIAEPVDLEELTASGENELQIFIDDLIDTLRAEDGVGIAAPQVSRSIQLLVVEYADNDRYPNQENIPITVFVNPVITRFSEETVSFWEGCLSLPDLRGLVPRSREVTVEAWSRNGEKMVVEAKGFFAVVLQHEIDHLQGKVFLDRMTDITRLSYNEEFETYWVEQETTGISERL